MTTTAPATPPAWPDLTPRQAAVLSYVLGRIGAGRPPTYRDVMVAFGITSPNGVRCHITALTHKGYLSQHAAGLYSGAGSTPARSLWPGPRLAGLTASREGDAVVVRRDGVPVLRLARDQADELAASLVRATKGG